MATSLIGAFNTWSAWWSYLTTTLQRGEDHASLILIMPSLMAVSAQWHYIQPLLFFVSLVMMILLCSFAAINTFAILDRGHDASLYSIAYRNTRLMLVWLFANSFIRSLSHFSFHFWFRKVFLSVFLSLFTVAKSLSSCFPLAAMLILLVGFFTGFTSSVAPSIILPFFGMLPVYNIYFMASLAMGIIFSIFSGIFVVIRQWLELFAFRALLVFHLATLFHGKINPFYQLVA